MNVLVACEFSGVVRDAFANRGHSAVSCDIIPTETLGSHYKGDIHDLLRTPNPWDLMIAFPPCTHLASSGARWFKDKQEEQKQAIEFFMDLVRAPIPRICIENPIGIMSTHYRKPDQIIQPWMFGHGETKATCLWLKNLPKLNPTKVVEGRYGRVWRLGPSETRWKDRSRTYMGIANAMAEQWGDLPELDYMPGRDQNREQKEEVGGMVE